MPRQYLSASPVRDNAVITKLGGSVSNPFRGLLPNSTSLNGSTVGLQQLLLPYPQSPSSGVIIDSAGAGSSYYESLNVRLQKRFTHGLTLISNFTWNRMEERLLYLNDTDATPEKRISGDSRPLREVLAVTYRLPIGRGKAFDPGSRVWHAVPGGWTVTGITVFQLGPPLSWGNLIYDGGRLNLSPHAVDTPAFDVTRFNTASAQQLASNIRTFDTLFNNLRRDSSKNLDLSVMKEVPFGERSFVQLRAEAFNSTNRVTMAAPNLSATASTFGYITTQANNPRRIQIGARVVW